MALNYISAAEAASLIKHGYNIGLSGFTPAGTAKAVTAELAKIAEAEHAKGNPFQIGIFTGASTGDSCDGVLSRVKAIRYRAPYTTNSDFRKAVNNGEIAYNDIHLSQMAQEVRYGFMGKVNVAIIEACEVTPDGKIYLTAAGGIAPTVCRLADQIIVELNAAHSKNAMGLHDVYEPLDPPYRREIPIYKPSDRIGLPYIQVDPKKIIGVVETNWPDEARSFAAADPLTDKIGQNVADFLAADMKRGIIPPTFLPLQSGVGNIANAVLGALGRDKTIPPFEMYTEVIQNSVIGLIREGRVKFGSACSLTVTNDCLEGIYQDMDFFRDKLVLRPSEISNSPEVVRRLGIISINTAIEADIYGNVNSTHIGGTKMMNGIGGADRAVEEAPVHQLTGGGGGIDDLQTPAYAGIDQEIGQNMVQRKAAYHGIGKKAYHRHLRSSVLFGYDLIFVPRLKKGTGSGIVRKIACHLVLVQRSALRTVAAAVFVLNVVQAQLTGVRHFLRLPVRRLRQQQLPAPSA